MLVSSMVRNSKLFRGGVVTPRPALNLENQGLVFVWPLPFHLYGSTRSFAPAIIGSRMSPLHETAAERTREHVIHMSLFPTTCVRNAFRSDKYFTSFAQHNSNSETVLSIWDQQFKRMAHPALKLKKKKVW
jgi:hypothetical protein